MSKIRHSIQKQIKHLRWIELNTLYQEKSTCINANNFDDHKLSQGYMQL